MVLGRDEEDDGDPDAYLPLGGGGAGGGGGNGGGGGGGGEEKGSQAGHKELDLFVLSFY